jgi:hypothetical protein
MRRWIWPISLLALGTVGCGGEGAGFTDATDPADLRRQLGVADVDVVGVTVAEDGRRYVLDARAGLYQLGAEGAALLISAEMLAAAADVKVMSRFTDVALTGEGRFLLTARDDGYVYDPDTGRVTQLFCYLPDPEDETDPESMPGEPTVFATTQMTHSLAYSPKYARIMAQPQSFDTVGEDATPIASHVALFSIATGEDVDWLQIADASFVAGGMALDSNDRLLLGTGNRIYGFVGEQQPLELLLELEGVAEISGMSIDVDGETLLVVDGPNDRMIEIPLP